VRDLLVRIVQIALEAGAEIERIYGAGCAAETKADGSPVTEADRRAEAIILDGLRLHFPDVPVLAEEESAAGRIPKLGTRFFCVDPLDGTKGFLQRNGEFTVNIALVEEGRPTAGVVYAPDMKLLYYGAEGEGAFRVRGSEAAQPIAPRPRPPVAYGLIGVGSRNHAAQGTEDRNRALGIASYVPSGSSLKFCLVAEGTADVYPRYGPTSEWDTAAGQAVLEAAGGRVLALDEQDREAGPLRYGKADRAFLNPNFIAWGV
jgi:3'(2'), 5'-bisphosphate nucleotidase